MLTDERLWDLWNSQGTDEMSKAEAFVFARAVETEVSKQDTALIRQLVYYLDRPTLNAEPVIQSTIKAARARLKETP